MSWYYLNLSYRTGARERLDEEHEDLGDAVRAALAVEARIMADATTDPARRPRHVDVVDEDNNIFLSIAIGYVRTRNG